MPSSKKKREADKQRLLRKGARRGRGGSSDVGFVKPDIHSEISHITQLALAAESRIVTVGELVFFSTRTRDAWLLDAEDNYAICLCREGGATAVSSHGHAWHICDRVDGQFRDRGSGVHRP